MQPEPSQLSSDATFDESTTANQSSLAQHGLSYTREPTAITPLSRGSENPDDTLSSSSDPPTALYNADSLNKPSTRPDDLTLDHEHAPEPQPGNHNELISTQLVRRDTPKFTNLPNGPYLLTR